jgi:flagellar biosynthesis regulator FlbT
MFKSNVAKIFNRKRNEDVVATMEYIETITTEQVVLEALCAYRDKLIMMDDTSGFTSETNLEIAAKLSLIHLAIEDAWQNTPVR